MNYTTGEHWDSAAGKTLDKKKDQYVRIQWKVPDEKTITTIITKKRLARDASLEQRLLHWKEMAKKVKPGNCVLHEKKIGIKEAHIHFEFYNWEKPETETSYDICVNCIKTDVMKQKLDTLKTLGKNPSFTPTITCSSTNICSSFTPPKNKGFNCAHIALKFETIMRKNPKGGGQVDLAPRLYCKRAHPTELTLPSEQDLDWNVAFAGSAVLLSQLGQNLKRARKEIKKNPALIETARKLFHEQQKTFEKALGISLDEKEC